MRPNPIQKVDDWVNSQALETLFISAVSVAELDFVIELLPEGKRKENFRTVFEEIMAECFGLGKERRVLNLDEKAARTYGKLRAKARKQGLAIGKSDGYIGAVAYSNKLSVVSRDTSPFEAMGLNVINPFE